MGFWEGLGRAAGSVANSMVTRAERQRANAQIGVDSGYNSARNMSDDELKSEIKRMKENGGIKSFRDAGTVKAAQERFSK